MEFRNESLHRRSARLTRTSRALCSSLKTTTARSQSRTSPPPNLICVSVLHFDLDQQSPIGTQHDVNQSVTRSTNLINQSQRPQAYIHMKSSNLDKHSKTDAQYCYWFRPSSRHTGETPEQGTQSATAVRTFPILLLCD